MRRLGVGEAAGQGDSSDLTLTNQEDIETSSAQENRDHIEYLSGLKFWLIIVTMTALIVLGGLDTNIVATAMPSITNDLHTVADVGWLYKLFSIKRIFLLAQAIFLMGPLLCSTAVNSAMFVVGRAVSGVDSQALLVAFSRFWSMSCLSTDARSTVACWA
ncbi:Major Facilitator Superfamily [Aspergillus sclerotialis]|uniref:Major Facilitator Superfamily n=1 Tax=Aspergillus sclerotialis TaxID=2070753 RepID=A0A3A2ZGC4_9EURO|nr:Major Facilitator Superfamily [Aspergillus sclerotialis]